MTTRAGFIAILGAPNAGKSTLLNRMAGTKLAIVTPKVQTTRNAIRAICMESTAQLIFIDTPGIFAAKKKFEQAMVASAWGGAADADVILLLVDAARRGIDDDTRQIIAALKAQQRQVVLVLNKIDRAKKENLLKLAQELGDTGIFSDTFMISAQTGDGVDDLRRFLAEKMPESPYLYPEDQLTDISERLLASEITREKLFMALSQELPYALMVETESFEQRGKSIKIHQVIYVQRESQKSIILGKGGAMIKQVGEAARKDMGELWGMEIHLFLFVKVREKWKENPEIYKYLGLDF